MDVKAPANDLFAHVLNGTDCWCAPDLAMRCTECFHPFETKWGGPESEYLCCAHCKTYFELDEVYDDESGDFRRTCPSCGRGRPKGRACAICNSTGWIAAEDDEVEAVFHRMVFTQEADAPHEATARRRMAQRKRKPPQ